MKLISNYNNQKFIIEEDLPAVGFYLYVSDITENCIADHLQDSENTAKEFAFEEYNVPMASWKQTE
jgi:hypothetical protein